MLLLAIFADAIRNAEKVSASTIQPLLMKN